jgi:hypothetical protein
MGDLFVCRSSVRFGSKRLRPALTQRVSTTRDSSRLHFTTNAQMPRGERPHDGEMPRGQSPHSIREKSCCKMSAGDKAELVMDTVTLIVIYIVTTVVYQSIGFGISRAVDYQFPTAGLLVFLILYLSAFYLAWPTAIRIFERLWGDRPLRGEDKAAAGARLERHRARQPAAKQNA